MLIITRYTSGIPTIQIEGSVDISSRSAVIESIYTKMSRGLDCILDLRNATGPDEMIRDFILRGLKFAHETGNDLVFICDEGLQQTFKEVKTIFFTDEEEAVQFLTSTGARLV